MYWLRWEVLYQSWYGLYLQTGPTFLFSEAGLGIPLGRRPCTSFLLYSWCPKVLQTKEAVYRVAPEQKMISLYFYWFWGREFSLNHLREVESCIASPVLPSFLLPALHSVYVLESHLETFGPFLVGEPELNIWLCVVSVWCPLDGCDAPIGQRGKTTVQSQSVCTVQVYTQPWAQYRHE